MKYGTIGSVSSGTLEPAHLLYVFTSELRQLAKNNKQSRQYAALLRDAMKDELTDDEKSEIIDELITALNDFAPPYFYFGANEGDGADFGFWLSALDDFDGLRVSDTSEIPRGYSGEVLHVNDHGNTTLYQCARGRCREVWAIV